MIDLLTFNMLFITAADDTLSFFILYFLEKIRFDSSCESSARQMIYMKCQALLADGSHEM